MKTQNQLSPFEQDFNGWVEGTKHFPSVTMVGSTGEINEIPFMMYSITTHIFQLKVMSSGMTFRRVRLKDIKEYYGLTGRDCKTCLKQLEELKTDLWYHMGLN